ncbi:MAG: glycosyltransferase [Trueperaceae bacterium]
MAATNNGTGLTSPPGAGTDAGTVAPPGAQHASGGDGPLTVAFLIPAFDEAANVARVVKVALSSGLGPVLVVDDGSTDGTAQVARAAGARVLRLDENAGKGGALAAGARELEQDVLVLLDADLVGLIPDQIRDLIGPVVRGEADMTRGSFTGGRWRTTAAQKIAPQLSGQRAVLREKLLSVPGLAESRYGVEVAITREAKEREWRLVEVDLPGVSQVMKEEKLGRWSGTIARLKMYRDVLMTLVSRRQRRP